jgi:hypothetical protein
VILSLDTLARKVDLRLLPGLLLLLARKLIAVF